MTKTVLFLTCLIFAGLGSVWFLSSLTVKKERQDYVESAKQEEESARTLNLIATLLKKSILAIPMSAPQPLTAPTLQEPLDIALQNPPDDATQRDWATNNQKRELTIGENRKELERYNEILTDPVAWKEKQRELEKEWQLNELERLHKLRLENPQEYEAQLNEFEIQRIQREIEFDERIEQQIDQVKERAENIAKMDP